mmetsp:Transcript_24575/g.46407  ORF Transcript_24575/g.46407 Transcript_24575/m.46407 type:complete len:302 (+) Transcript_24575:153-1058(+)
MYAGRQYPSSQPTMVNELRLVSRSGSSINFCQLLEGWMGQRRGGHIAVVRAATHRKVGAELEVLRQQAIEALGTATHVWGNPVAVDLTLGEERALLIAKATENLLVGQAGALEGRAAMPLLVSGNVKARAKAQVELCVCKSTGLCLATGERAGSDGEGATSEVSTLLVAGACRLGKLLFVTCALVAISQLLRGCQGALERHRSWELDARPRHETRCWRQCGLRSHHAIQEMSNVLQGFVLRAGWIELLGLVHELFGNPAHGQRLLKRRGGGRVPWFGFCGRLRVDLRGSCLSWLRCCDWAG